ncbi:diguanylate cyclase (GGDEF)-like protein [Chromobacterium alkanivorans]|uniref:GGDEF domain-containing protein n=1 Tax=Chromobacterium alkanivorans TaxID=1071719 RepID=UPI0019680A12|nr:sensor domain-containing diguanylate cyclase [Chromobacterium alkanivorans]MBN3004196.1 sensor domain-containing diguanylate cyclase [Chromobacterium alkanivorans]MCS3806659.1 diguanylate cyclase (GGDEF)-like protein [Chromobacterium alkanivorans]MCS3820997.1 diguanylate cyclase (GGDEF)-like protein [Chromobacterium alkanivorans]MCS3875919.1 diguanylate cyclase (GGDEF)-like protein [Chromobacterium alkanivorans]
MNTPDIPADEPQRLATLRALGVLDTAAEERFDRLTRMAKRLFRVPIALVSLVDENRQWFKSCVGLAASETGRDISFCGHAILGDDIFYIPDALADERFADNPLVTGAPHIRFYAGCPLHAANGAKVGTLCVIDVQPREFDHDDAQALHDLARMVEAELIAFQAATTDELTGISNRRGFRLLAQYSLNFCARQNLPVSLAFLDLDKFKAINDCFGHAAGDQALATFAELMRSSFRSADLLARLGGDEFVVLLSEVEHERAHAAVAKFSRHLDAYNAGSGQPYQLAFSDGIVELDAERHFSIEALLAEGDELMYSIKAAKR